MTLPSTLVGKLIAIIFTLTGLGLFGVFIGKIGDMFNEYREYHRLGHAGTDFEDHIVIIGWDTFARLVTEQLLLSGQDVAVVTDNKEHIDLIYEQFDRDSVFVFYSTLNNYENLRKVNIDQAFRVLINDPSDTETLVNLLNIKSHFPDTERLVTLQKEELKDSFLEAGAYAAVSLFRTPSNLIASNIFEPQSAKYLGDLITSVENGEDHEIQQYKITQGDAFAGRDYEDVFKTLFEEHNCVAIGVTKHINGARKLLKLPEDDVTLEPGDYLIVIVQGSRVEAMEEAFDITQGLQPGDSGEVQ